jgi:hypothetical protein
MGIVIVDKTVKKKNSIERFQQDVSADEEEYY